MIANIPSTAKRKAPDFYRGLFFYFFLFATSNANAASGSGIHQKSWSSDKLADSFPIKYMAMDATIHNTPRM
jgi:hypothetical protein